MLPRFVTDFLPKKTVGEEVSDRIRRHIELLSDDGVRAKMEANANNKKVYTKEDSSKIINTALAESLSFGEAYGNLRGKSRAEAVDMLWKGLNATPTDRRASVALNLAKYIIRNAVWKNVII